MMLYVTSTTIYDIFISLKIKYCLLFVFAVSIAVEKETIDVLETESIAQTGDGQSNTAIPTLLKYLQ